MSLHVDSFKHLMSKPFTCTVATRGPRTTAPSILEGPSRPLQYLKGPQRRDQPLEGTKRPVFATHWVVQVASPLNPESCNGVGGPPSSIGAVPTPRRWDSRGAGSDHNPLPKGMPRLKQKISTWIPKVCNTMAFWATFKGLDHNLAYILLRSTSRHQTKDQAKKEKNSLCPFCVLDCAAWDEHRGLLG